jgi:uncharacterized protein (UPF0332 family)
MSFAWQDYLTLAEALLQARTTLAPEEACCRTAISRAYYAVYNIACTRAQTHEGLQLPATGDAHQRVIMHYFRGPSPLHRAIGDSLRQLRSVRNRADYDAQFDQAVARAGFVVQRARTLMTQLQALIPIPPPADTGGSAETTEPSQDAGA